MITDIRAANSVSNYTLPLMLVLALLAMQWPGAHVHFAEHHRHDGIHHQHQFKYHTHQLVEHSAAAKNVSHHASLVHDEDHEHAVAFDDETRLPKRVSPKNTSLVAVRSFIQLRRPDVATRIKIPVTQNKEPGHFHRSAHNPRAPPKASA